MKAINESQLQQQIAPFSGSKKRLMQYRKNLEADKLKVWFDDKLDDILYEYAKDKADYLKVKEYLNNLTDDDGVAFGRSVKQAYKMDEAIERFKQPDYTSFRWNKNYQETLNDLRLWASKLHLQPLTYVSDEDIRDALSKVDTHSGFTYILTGKKAKSEHMDNILANFEERLKKALSEGSFNMSIMMAERTQCSGEFDDLTGEETDTCKHKTRVVSMIDLYFIILECKYLVPFQRSMNFDSRYAGGKDNTEIGAIISNCRSRFQYYISLDYSSYDQTISSWLLEDAYSIIHEAFRWVDEDEWNLIVKDSIYKNFITADGIAYSQRGVASGLRATNIIDSIVNWIMVGTAFKALGVQRYHMLAMGDDNLIYTNDGNVLDDLCSYITKNFGITVNQSKSTRGTRSDNPEFLSRFWRFDGQWRHPHVLQSKLLFPERKREYSSAVGPQHVIYCFILMYKPAMAQFIDVDRFLNDFKLRGFDVKQVDARLLPGAMAYIRDYTMHNVRRIA